MGFQRDEEPENTDPGVPAALRSKRKEGGKYCGRHGLRIFRCWLDRVPGAMISSFWISQFGKKSVEGSDVLPKPG